MKRSNAFTLIELLVVMGIIAILMALMFPAINAAKSTARKTRARAEIKQLETAWKSLLSDMPTRKWPLDAVDGNPTEMTQKRVLCLVSNNPLSYTYMEFSTNALHLGQMRDPWWTSADFRYYRLVLDDNYDNQVSITRGSGTKQLKEVVSRSVAAWSDGPSKSDPNDDILGW
jgi:prepilin-type N-terminal cleavage/methylation domain-containing protein